MSFTEQNKLFDEINNESPTITLNKAANSVLNVGGSKIFLVPQSTIQNDAPKKLPKKRVKCKLFKIISAIQYFNSTKACRSISESTRVIH